MTMPPGESGSPTILPRTDYCPKHGRWTTWKSCRCRIHHRSCPECPPGEAMYAAECYLGRRPPAPEDLAEIEQRLLIWKWRPQSAVTGMISGRLTNDRRHTRLRGGLGHR
jgi:hypothetical protein